MDLSGYKYKKMLFFLYGNQPVIGMFPEKMPDEKMGVFRRDFGVGVRGDDS